MNYHDISRPIRTGMPVWPGDTPAEFTPVATIPAGSSVNVGRLTLSVHAGTHADAPFHYNQHGTTIDALPLDLFVGPARVVDVRGHARLSRELLASRDLAGAPRLLFKSDSWTDPDVFPTEWPLFDPDVPAWLAGRGVRLIGMDVPSVDHLTSKDLPIHHAIDRAGLIILESLDLRAVAPGLYELIALPLRLRGGDGSPLRAVLRPLAANST